MTEPTGRQEQTFIVRTWYEPTQLPHRPAEWRGFVEHVQSQDRRYFRDLADLCAFITRAQSGA